MLTVGAKWPNYSVKACCGNTPDDLKEVNQDTYAGKWKVFIFYPKDFTFVCPTELVEFGQNEKEFAKRKAVLLGASTDNEFSHLAWRQSHPQLKNLPYPLLATPKLATELGILDPVEGVCLRATYIVDPDNVIQFASANSLPVGRNVKEVLRVLDAVQSKELTPCNWSPGDPFLKV